MAVKRLEFSRGPGKLFEDVHRRTLEPVWSPYLYSGELSYLEGLPGTGKTTILCDLASRITRGDTQPLSKRTFTPRPVVMLFTEDSVDAVASARIEAAGGAAKGMLTLVEERVDFEENWLRRALAGGGLLLVETLSHHLPPGINQNNEHDVREALAPLTGLLRDTGSACLAVRHWNKRHARHMFRGLGSIGFNAVARTVTACVQSHVENQYTLVPIKNNYARPPRPIVYRMEGVRDTVKIDWLEYGEGEWEIPGLGPTVSRAVHFLQGLFAAQPVMLAKDARAALNTVGISQHSAESAAAYLRVEMVKSSLPNGPWLWVSERGPKGRRLRLRFEYKLRAQALVDKET